MADEQQEETEQDEKGKEDEEKDSDSGGASEHEDRWERAHEKVKELEDDPPKDLDDWPDDERKYVTFGGGEGDHGYDEGPEVNLGPSSVRRFEDGSVEVDGEKVDNPDDYKMESIEGQTDHPVDDDKGDDGDSGGDDDADSKGDDDSDES